VKLMGFLSRFTKPEAKVTLKISQKTIGLGDNFNAVITLSSQDEFDASGVRAEILCIEKRRRERWVYNERRRKNVRRTYWDIATLHSAELKASEKLHVVPGFFREFPVVVNVPAGSRESFDGLDANVRWTIKGVVAIKGRPDLTSRIYELQVVSPSVAEKTEKKEIMITCDYCGSVYPQTLSHCSNCGAPRKS
jgi:hypothetical protein